MTSAMASGIRAARPGRRLLGVSALLVLATMITWIVQIYVFKQLTVPWYVPVLGVLAASLAIVSFAKSPSIRRGVLAALIAALGIFEAFFVIRATLLPEYHGPIAIGSPFPAFSVERAGSGRFNEADLRGQPTVLTFFRGRW